jgi:hypothetical protein
MRVGARRVFSCVYVRVGAAVYEDANDLLRVFGQQFGASELNLFFGADVDHLTKCVDLVREAATGAWRAARACALRDDFSTLRWGLLCVELVCKAMPRGVGKMLVVVERLTETDEVEARHRAWWSYETPVVSTLTGGADGLPLIVGGEHFGPNDGSNLVEVYVGAYAAHSPASPCVVVDARGTEIRCAGLPHGFGSQLHVTVCVASVCGTSARPLVDYPAPIVDYTRLVDGRLHLYGTGFGPHASSAKRNVADVPVVALEIDGQLCANAEVRCVRARAAFLIHHRVKGCCARQRVGM